MVNAQVSNNSQGDDQATPRFADIVTYFKRKHPPGRFRIDRDQKAVQWVFSNAYGSFPLMVRWDQQCLRSSSRSQTAQRHREISGLP